MMLCTLLLAVASLVPAGESVRYVDASLEFDDELLDHRFVDLEAGGGTMLCLALRLPGGQRELRLHPLGRHGFDPEPAHSIPVLEDVLAYGFADVRQEPGRELVFLTRSGAWSYSLTLDGYRGNIRRLVEEDLLYDVPDNRTLSYWAYVLPAAGGDLLLLPGSEAFGIWGPSGKESSEDSRVPTYSLIAGFAPQRHAGGVKLSSGDGGNHVTVGGGGSIRFERGDGDGIFLTASESSSTLLSDGKNYSAPALVDLDGDGDQDLVERKDETLSIHLADGGRVPTTPTRIEDFPDYLKTEHTLSLALADLDGDGDLDLVAQIKEDVDGFENAEIRVLLLVNDGARLLPAEPRQVLRFEGAVLRVEVVDIDGNGHPDLVMRKFELPSMLETVTGLEFRLSHLIFFGLGSGPGSPLVERQPGLNQTQVFDENTVGDAVKNRRLELDCDGDGIPDLVEIDLQGRIAIRRLRLESGFFSGDTWELDENPWKRFETRGSVFSIDVTDVNGDGLGDLVSPGARSLTLFLSSRTR